MAPHAEPRSAERQRVADIPQVDIVHSAAGNELAITVHVHVPEGFVVPGSIKANVAEAVASIVFPSESTAAPVAEEEQDS